MSSGNTAKKIIIQPFPAPPGTKQWLQWITPPPSRLSRLGLSFLLSLVAIILGIVFCGFVNVYSDKQFGTTSWSKSFATYAAVMLGGPIFVYLFRYARRIRSRHALQAVQKDTRAPLLLLRAFRDDYYKLPGYEAKLPVFDVVKVTATFEEYLYEQLSQVGPVIAIGRPRERTPPLGAPRFWVADDKWKLVVQELLRECQYVIMIMGNLDTLRKQGPGAQPGPLLPPPAPGGAPVEDGLTWEVRQLFGLREIQKVILLMPPVEEQEAAHRWEQYRALSNYRVPPYQGGELGAVFAPDGSCWVLRGPFIKGWFQQGYKRDLSTYQAVLEVKPK